MIEPRLISTHVVKDSQQEFSALGVHFLLSLDVTLHFFEQSLVFLPELLNK